MTSTTLRPLALTPLPLGTILPAGWLRKQLHTQADGLSGHLDEFWPDIADSQWIGGNAEGWERGPYWLDGLVPLAVLLNDEKLLGKARRWMEYILAHQHADGWLGPLLDDRPYDVWPLTVLCKAMLQYEEATGDARVIPAMLRAMEKVRQVLADMPLESWAKMRWQDLAWCLGRLYDRTGEAWLLDVYRQVQAQGYNWLEHARHFTWTERQSSWTYEAHVVNQAMGIKDPAMRYRLSGDADERGGVEQFIEVLDRFHGQLTGVFTGDECLAGKNPSQGTELCAVVEYLFSLELALVGAGRIKLRRPVGAHCLQCACRPPFRRICGRTSTISRRTRSSAAR